MNMQRWKSAHLDEARFCVVVAPPDFEVVEVAVFRAVSLFLSGFEMRSGGGGANQKNLVVGFAMATTFMLYAVT